MASRTVGKADENDLLVSYVDLNPEPEDFLSAVFEGLSAEQKFLPCKFFYDERGSQLFDQICDLEEYYPTRTEIGILEDRLGEIAELVGRGAHLVELGSGASVKIRTLLNALPDLAQYTAVDISRDFLLQSAETLAIDYPGLDVAAICADYTQNFEILSPVNRQSSRNVAFFPGSTIGNFTRDEAKTFLTRLHGILGPGSGLLIGVDLKKDSDILHAAYNDAKGVTAAFNLNLLHRINRELGAQIDVDSFSHVARYDAPGGFVEMRLRSDIAQTIEIGGNTFDFEEGETIHTEYSCKYDIDEFQQLAAASSMTPTEYWVDDDTLFSIHYLTAQ